MQSEISLKINDIYIPLLNDRSRYLNLYGSSGSGKSVFASQKVLLRVMSENTHRFLCARKISATLRESVYKRFKNEISAMGLMPEFRINQTEMRFTHIPTGNEIILTGLDDVEKLKSIEGITSMWIEEATELTPEDFDQLDLRMRGINPNYKQIILSYNPIDENHWIKKRFHDNPDSRTTILKTTFRDNYFLDDDYRHILESKANVNPNMYRIYYLGEWGREEVQRPFAYNFNDKHISTAAIYIPAYAVYFAIDFNVEPFVCLCFHHWIDTKGEHLHCFKEIVIEKNGDVHEMCNRLFDTFGNAMFHCVFTGDAMQRKREITQKNNIDAWKIIDSRFHCGQHRLKVPRANPEVEDSRHLINTLFAFHPDLKINPECKGLIYELKYSEVDADGVPIKKNRADEKQRYDHLDAFRYMCNTFCRDWLERYRIK